MPNQPLAATSPYPQNGTSFPIASGTGIQIFWSDPGTTAANNRAAMFHLRISTVPDLSSGIVQDTDVLGDLTGLYGQASYAFAINYGVTYYWRVWSWNGWNGNTSTLSGTPSPIWSFTPFLVNNTPVAPTLIAPSPGATDVALAAGLVTFQWREQTGGQPQPLFSYTLEVARNSDGSGAVATQANIAPVAAGATATKTIALEYNLSYAWRVTSINSFGSITTPWQTFTTIARADKPAAPILISPANLTANIVLSNTLSRAQKFTWGDGGLGTNAAATSYRIQVATSSLFTPTTLVHDLDTGSSTIANLVLSPGRNYFWQVRATNSFGTTSSNQIFSFTTAAATLQEPLPPVVTIAPPESAPERSSALEILETGLSTDPIPSSVDQAMIVCMRQVLVVGPKATIQTYPQSTEEPVLNGAPVETDAPMFGPVMRVGEPLRAGFVNEDVFFSAADSYSQYAGYGSVGGFQWSSNGRASSGSGSTARYRWSTPGLKTVFVSARDGAGFRSEAVRFVYVCRRPESGADMGEQATSSFQWSSCTEEIRDGTWGGSRIQVTVQGGEERAQFFKRGAMICIHQEEYSSPGFSVGSENWTRHASGTFWCGFVEDPSVETKPGATSFSFTAVTIEGVLGWPGIDLDMTFLLDRTIHQTLLGGVDPTVGPAPQLPPGILPPDIVQMNPWHIISNLTFGRTIYHYLRFHIGIDIEGYQVYNFPGLISIVRDWWNDTPLGFPRPALPWFVISRGPARRQLEALCTQSLFLGYSTRKSELVITLMHAAKAVRSGDNGNLPQGEFTSDTLYHPVRPIPGAHRPVRGVILKSVTSLTKPNENTLIVNYDRGGTGSILNPSGWGFWFQSQEEGERLAESFWLDANMTDQIEIHTPGHPADLNAIFRYRMSSIDSTFNWSHGQEGMVTSIRHEYTADFLGGHRSFIRSRAMRVNSG